MSNIVPVRAAGVLNSSQIDLVRRTVAKDCEPAEFDLFMAQAQRAGLDPLRRQISAIVFNKSSAKRQLAIVTTIDGLRAIAARHGDYRPMDSAPLIEVDQTLKSPLNPHGLVRAEVRCWKRFGPDWHPIVGEAWWDEFAPLKDEWANGQKTGQKTLGDTWARMPRLMLAKVAEAQALRRGWPDDMGGIYAEEELSRALVIDATATEMVERHHEDQRQKRLGGSEAVMLFVGPEQPLERVERGKLADRLLAIYREADSVDLIDWFRRANQEPLKQFWAWSPGDALEVKAFAEARVEQLRRQATETQKLFSMENAQ